MSSVISALMRLNGSRKVKRPSSVFVHGARQALRGMICADVLGQAVVVLDQADEVS